MQDIEGLLQAYQDLPQDQRDALTLYATSGHWQGGDFFAYDINKSLRAGVVPPAATNEIAAIDAAIASYPLTYPATVYRAVDDVAHLGTLSVGMPWSSTTFISTSTWWGNLHTHLKSPAGGGTTAAVLTLRLPQGTTAAYLGGTPSMATEREILLGRSMSFRVISFGAGNLSNYNIPLHVPRGFAGVMEVTLVST